MTINKRTLWKCAGCNFSRRVVGKPKSICIKCGSHKFTNHYTSEVHIVPEKQDKNKSVENDKDVLSHRLSSAFDTARDDMVKMKNSIDELVLSLRNEENISQDIKMQSKDKYENLLIDIQQIINTIHEHDRLVACIGREINQERILRNKIDSLLDCVKNRDD